MHTHDEVTRKAVRKALYAVIPAAVVGMCVAGVALAGGFSKEFGRAIANDDMAAVTRLIAEGADVNAANKDGETPLMIAALEGRVAVVEMFLAKGADIGARDAVGATPLMYAVEGGSLDVLRLLLAKGADPAATTNGGDTALSIAEANRNKKAAQLLRKAGKKK